MIRFAQEILTHLNIPSIPKRVWDGASSFRDGVAVVEGIDGSEMYAACTFDADNDIKPYIKKVFGNEPFSGIKEIYIVPNYMNTDVESFDLDEESTERAKSLIEEAADLEAEADNKETAVDDWVFDEIHNKEEATAWVREYRRRNKIKGRIPKNEDDLKAYLYVVKSDMNKKKSKRNKR